MAAGTRGTVSCTDGEAATPTAPAVSGNGEWKKWIIEMSSVMNNCSFLTSLLKSSYECSGRYTCGYPHSWGQWELLTWASPFGIRTKRFRSSHNFICVRAYACRADGCAPGSCGRNFNTTQASPCTHLRPVSKLNAGMDLTHHLHVQDNVVLGLHDGKESWSRDSTAEAASTDALHPLAVTSGNPHPDWSTYCKAPLLLLNY